MAARTEVLGDGLRGREEPLRVARGLEALHPLLALPGGLVRVLGTVVKIPVLPMFHSWKDLALSGAVARQFVSDEDARYVGQPCRLLADLARSLSGRRPPSAGSDRVQDPTG
jgi:hypothetical protein